MSITRFVTADGLPAFLAHLSKSARVLAPVEKPGNKTAVVFEPWKEGKPFTLAKATVPAKEAVLPQCEVLVRYSKTKDPNDPGKCTMTLDDTPQAEPTVVFGSRPCDARGYVTLDRPYLHGPFADPYYKARRDQLTVITLTCPSGCSTCFCHWVGGGPTSPEGSDVLMTEVEGGYVLQAMTDKGAALLEGSSLADGADRFADAEAARKAAEERERQEKEDEKRRKEEARLERARRLEEEKKNRGKKKPGQKKNDEPEQEGVNKNDSREGIRAYARGRAYIPDRFGGVTPYKDPDELMWAQLQAAEEKRKKKKGEAKEETAAPAPEQVQEQTAPETAETQALESAPAEEAAPVEETAAQTPAAPETESAAPVEMEEVEVEVEQVEVEVDDQDDHKEGV